MGRLRAHPRSRGENRATGPPARTAKGSSPLTRGKLHEDADLIHRNGLIPAHAGKTQEVHAVNGAIGAHPRSRGENGGEGSRGPSVRGSSPLTRGKPRYRRDFAARPGLIPAHAGKTPSSASSLSLSRAHPRSRGENQRDRGVLRQQPGSSPLTRGKRPVGASAVPLAGLIPAHAGKTRGQERATQWVRAHPRSRGENFHAVSAPASAMGSSPLTRGKPAQPDERADDDGSSPLTRGKPYDRRHHAPQSRLIPAHAGKTRDGVLKSMSIGAHPRSRGENRAPVAKWRDRGGSSPLTRGKRAMVMVLSVGEGLIPAHAGKTSCPATRRGH